jgi:hypothetical protein
VTVLVTHTGNIGGAFVQSIVKPGDWSRFMARLRD